MNKSGERTQRLKALRSMTPSARVTSGQTGINASDNTIDPMNATSFGRLNDFSISTSDGRLSSTMKRFSPNSLQKQGIGLSVNRFIKLDNYYNNNSLNTTKLITKNWRFATSIRLRVRGLHQKKLVLRVPASYDEGLWLRSKHQF